MKAKALVPIVALCLGSSLWSGFGGADDAVRTSGRTQAATANPWMFSQIMNATVKDLQGDNLGKLKDVVVDPVTGRATFAVIELSGDVGRHGAYAPVPWSLLNPVWNTPAGEPKTITLNVDKTKFASAQRFYLNQWPDYNQATWGPQVYSYYGVDRSALGVGAGATGVSLDTWSQGYYHYGMDRYGPTRADGTPIDNGTAPDGKGTFVRGPLY